MSIRNLPNILAVAATVAVAGSSFVHAQQSGQPNPPDRPNQSRTERFRPTADDLGAFTDARVAAIRAGLRLNAEQEKNWPAFEEAFRNLAKLRTDRVLAFRDGPPTPPTDMLEGLQRRADVLSRAAAALRQVADATTPLYKSLDDAQKRRFAMLAPMLRQPGWQPNFRREGRSQDRFQPRSMDRPRGGGGAMERIRFDSHSVEQDETKEPGIRAAHENGWR